MKTGIAFADLLANVKNTHESKRDYSLDTRALSLKTDKDGSILTIDGLPESEIITNFNLSDRAHSQIRERLGIPADYYKKLRGSAHLHGLLDHNVNQLFNLEPENRLVRTLDGGVRAFLSDRYQVIDNYDILATCLPELTELADRHGAVVESADITEAKMYIKIKLPGIQYDLGQIKSGPYQGLMDVLHPMIYLTNSEVGSGAVRIQPGIFRLVCENGLMCDEAALTQYHVSRSIQTNKGGRVKNGHHFDGAKVQADVTSLLSDEAKEADDKAFLLKIRDVMRAAVTSMQFEKLVDTFGATQGLPIKAPKIAIEVLSNRASLTNDDGERIFEALLAGGDLSLYGLINAVTFAAQDTKDYDKATELEELGGKLLANTNEIQREILSASAR